MAMDEMNPDPFAAAMTAGVESLKQNLGATAGHPVGVVVLCVIYDPERKEDLRVAGTYSMRDVARVMESGAKSARAALKAPKRQRPK